MSQITLLLKGNPATRLAPCHQKIHQVLYQDIHQEIHQGTIQTLVHYPSKVVHERETNQDQEMHLILPLIAAVATAALHQTCAITM
jgi:hypothetical protein